MTGWDKRWNIDEVSLWQKLRMGRPLLGRILVFRPGQAGIAG
jgi:hypothetical protein